MNAIDMLKEDHRVVDDLFKRIEDTPPSKHPPIFKRIKNELDTHAHVEEKIFYPQLKSKGNKELVEITTEGIEEHRQIKKFLSEIARSTSTEKREAKLKVLIEDTRHHVEDEEGEMFPLVEDQFTAEELEALGDRMAAEKKKFQKAKRIPARRQPPKGPIETVMAGAKDLIASALLMGGEKKSGSRKTSSPKGSKPSAAKASRSSAKSSSNGKSNGSKSGSAANGKAKSSSSSSSARKAASSKKGSTSSRSRSASR